MLTKAQEKDLKLLSRTVDKESLQTTGKRLFIRVTSPTRISVKYCISETSRSVCLHISNVTTKKQIFSNGRYVDKSLV